MVEQVADEYIINVTYSDHIDRYQRVVAASGIIWYKWSQPLWPPYSSDLGQGTWKELVDGDNERMEAAYQSGRRRGMKH